MEDQKVNKVCFFYGSHEAIREINRLKEEYDDVTVESLPLQTKREGTIGITVVFYSSLKKSELFSDEEWEKIYGGK